MGLCKWCLSWRWWGGGGVVVWSGSNGGNGGAGRHQVLHSSITKCRR